MACSCHRSRSRLSSYGSLNSSRTSLSDDFNNTFSSDSSDYVFYQNKELKLGRLLGSGGFGSVYEGKCSGRKLAVKKLHHNQKNIRAVSQSFLAEKGAMFLRHRNIVRILDATTLHSNQLKKSERFVIMEYAGNRNLLSVLNNEKERISRFDRVRYASDIANALHHIHKLNIVHLDVKPANIIVTIKNTCKLGDFGCCKVLPKSGQGSPTTPTNSNLTGTLAYTSPELLKGELPTYKADMYSYGICLWQLLTREKPYGNENMYVVIFGVVSYQLRPKITPRQQAENKSYTRLLNQLWSANPDDRPTARQVMIKLRSMRTRHTRTATMETKERWRF